MTEQVHYRLSQYSRWEKNCAYLGGGLGGLVLFGDLAKDSFQLAPPHLRAFFITFIVVGGTALGRAYIGYLSAYHKLQAWQKTSGAEENADVPADNNYRYPRSSKYSFWLALSFSGLAGALLVIASWWPVICPSTQ